MSELVFRPYGFRDLYGVISLLNLALPTEAISPERFTERVLLDPNFNPSSAVVAMRNGKVVGFILPIVRKYPLEDAAPDLERGYITLFAVHPDHQNQGIGTALFEAVETNLRERDCRSVLISPYAPNYWFPGVDSTLYPEAIGFLEKRGYQITARPLSMSVSLVGYRQSEWTKGAKERLFYSRDGRIILAPFDRSLTLPFTQFLAREFPGDWQRYLRDAMRDILQGRRSPESVWLAVDSHAAVLGFAQFEGERFGPFGVAASKRGQGIGAVLLSRTLEQMQRQGVQNAYFVWSDDKTAERLYKPVGFTETRRFAILHKSLVG